MKSTLVSVVITCHKYEEYLQQAVASIAQQTYRNIELIIIHDGCTDNKRYGVCRRRNEGIAEAQGEYIVLLDADDYLAPDYVEKCLAQVQPRKCITTWVQFFGAVDQQGRHTEFTLRDFLTLNRAHISTMMPKQAWKDVGGFDERCQGLEDWEFWIRVKAAGYEFDVIKEFLLFYRRHGDSKYYQDKETGVAVIDYIMDKHKNLYNKYL